jgi:hypothetical protein
VLPNFQIIGFRGFRHLTLDRLGRVNLVVGKNNVGKSSLLEAINLYSQDGFPAAIVSLLRDREQIQALQHSDNPEILDTALFAVMRLFYGGDLTPDSVAPIRMGPVAAPEREISITLEWRALSSEPPLTETMPSAAFDNVDLSSLGPRVVVNSPITGQTRIPLASLVQTTLKQHAVWHMERRLRNGTTDPIRVTPNGIPNIQLGMWWRHITLTPLENVVLEALRIVEPDLERVTVVTDDTSLTRDVTVLALLKGETRPVPLSSLGDGMNRVLGIVLALIKAKGGLLLIDEVENGLHYSIQTDLWRLILRTAEQLDVQVFATSHSWDSIAAFQQASAENQVVQGYLIRLLRQDGDVIANILDERKLGIATRQDIEVR